MATVTNKTQCLFMRIKRMRLLLLFWGSLLIAACTHVAKVDANALSKCTTGTYNNLGFYGIHLGMSRAEVKEVVRCSSVYGPAYVRKDGNDNSYLSVNKPVGCKGETGKGACYWISNVTLQYFNDRLIMLSLESPTYSYYEFDYYVRDWASFALTALTKKYNVPAKRTADIKKFNIDIPNDEFEFFIEEWEMPAQENIAITIGKTIDRGYYASIKYFQSNLFKRPINDPKNKIQSNL